jgi:hypothetical protein
MESTTVIVERAVALSETIRRVNRRRPFEQAVREFVRLVSTVPDYPAREFSRDFDRVADDAR